MSFAPRLCETPLFKSYMDALLVGDRPAASKIVDEADHCGVNPRDLLLGLIWPAMETIRELHKSGKISLVAHHLSTRLNRALCDRVCGNLPREAANGRRVLLACGGAEPEELGGQITADLFESAGFEVKFIGGGVPNDEILHLIGQWRPDLLVMFATLPSDMPHVRKLIDYLRDVGSCPNMQVMCCGGIYKRAEGLAEEVGADLVARDAEDAVEVAIAHPARRASADQQTVGRSRRVRKAAEKAQPTLTDLRQAA